MAATREQGTSLAGLLGGFTAFPAGLAIKSDHPVAGITVALIGAVLTIASLVQMLRIRPLELLEDKGGKE